MVAVTGSVREVMSYHVVWVTTMWSGYVILELLCVTCRQNYCHFLSDSGHVQATIVIIKSDTQRERLRIYLALWIFLDVLGVLQKILISAQQMLHYKDRVLKYIESLLSPIAFSL